MLEPEALERVRHFLASTAILARENREGDGVELDEAADLFADIRSGSAIVYYRCCEHDQHRGGVPLMEVSMTFDAFKFARLSCGHRIFYEGTAPPIAKMLPCVHCMEECHS